MLSSLLSLLSLLLSIPVELIVTSKKRADHLLRVKVGWGGKWSLPPRVSETGGIHILPYLTIGDQKYPLGMTIPENTAETRSIVASLKKRFAKKWRRELWRHIVRVIIEDIR